MRDHYLQGVFPIMVTTFDDQGGLDLEGQLSLLNYLIEQGAHGIGLFGIASEGYALTEDERRQLMAVVKTEVRGRVPLVVSSGHNGTDAAVRISKEAEDMGADMLMIMPPSFLRTDGDGLLYYYEAISKAISIPIMIQDAPLMTAVALPPALLARMAREIEHVKYVKVEAPPTGPKVSAVLRESRDGLGVFGGMNGQFLFEELARGATGTMPGSDMTALYVRIWNLFKSGQSEAAWRIFANVLPLIRFQLQPGMGVSAMKHNLVNAGVIRSAYVRHPTVALDNESVRELQFLREHIQCV